MDPIETAEVVAEIATTPGITLPHLLVAVALTVLSVAFIPRYKSAHNGTRTLRDWVEKLYNSSKSRADDQEARIRTLENGLTELRTIVEERLPKRA